MPPKELLTFRIEPALRRQIRRIICHVREAGGEMTEAVFIRTALRLHARREEARLQIEDETGETT